MLESKKFLINSIAVCVVCIASSAYSCKGKSNAALPENNSPTVIIEATPINAPEANSQKVKFTSVYTKLDSKSCRPVSKPEGEEDEVPDICDGYKNYKIFVSHHGTATRIYIGTEITKDADAWDASTLPEFIANGAGDGQTIEWRLADGEPFACIVRAEYDKQIINPDESGMANELIVKNLKGFAPINEAVDAKKNSRANDEARRLADAAFRKL